MGANVTPDVATMSENPMPKAKGRSILFWLAAGTSIGWLPLVSLLIANGLAGIAHCKISEAGPLGPCIILGADHGQLIAEMALAFWYFLLTAPLAFASLVFWVLLGLRELKLIR